MRKTIDSSKYLHVRNWDKWQSKRKDRGGYPWIKVYRRLMMDSDWLSLSDAEKGQLISFWMVAADRDGLIPSDPKTLCKICHLDTIPNVKSFIDKGFLDNQMSTKRQPNVNQKTTKCQPNVNPEERRIEKIRKEEIRVDDLENESIKDTVLLNEIRDAWNVMAGKCGLNQVIRLSESRKTHLGARLKDPVFQKGWKTAIETIPSRGFLLGENDRSWKIDFDFFLKPDTIVKILEGKYASQKPSTPPSQPVPLNRYTRFAADRQERINAKDWDFDPENNPGEKQYQEYKAQGLCE